jgi:hypothetical protein
MEFTNSEVLAEMLAHACAGEYRVIEFRTADGQTTVADVTDHHRRLEQLANDDFADETGWDPLYED